MFSPYYAWARRRTPQGRAEPQSHCALNVALYGRNGGWAMTERGSRQLRRDATTLEIGPSALRWDGDELRIDIDERTVPWLTRVRGTVTVHAPRRFHHPIALAPQHRWHPTAPAARVEVDLGTRHWSGPAYLDANHGDAPLEHAFRRWDWSRAWLSRGRSAVFYDVDRADGTALEVGRRFDPDGSIHAIEPPARSALPHTLWRVPRHARSEPGTAPRVLQTLTDAPFYARSLVDAQWLGEPVTTMHESLSLTRFDSAWVQAMLPFRMPRVAR